MSSCTYTDTNAPMPKVPTKADFEYTLLHMKNYYDKKLIRLKGYGRNFK